MVVSNKDIVEAFKAAIPRLAKTKKQIDAGDGYEFICRAIDKVVLPIEHRAAAKEIISSRIYPSNTFCNWLFDKGFREAHTNGDKMQSHRHAWLKLLVEEFESK